MHARFGWLLVLQLLIVFLAGSMDDLSSFGVYDDLQKPGAVPSKQVSQQTLSVLAHPHLAAKPLMVTATLNRHRRRPPPFSKAASNDGEYHYVLRDAFLCF